MSLNEVYRLKSSQSVLIQFQKLPMQSSNRRIVRGLMGNRITLQGSNHQTSKRQSTWKIQSKSSESRVRESSDGEIFKFMQRKMDDTIVHHSHPFSSRSLKNKHFYNMEKKLQNLKEVFEVIQELYDYESHQLKDQLKEVLFYQGELLNKYESYQNKLKKLEIQQTRKAIQKVNDIFAQQSKSKPKNINGQVGFCQNILSVQIETTLHKDISQNKNNKSVDQESLKTDYEEISLRSIQNINQAKRLETEEIKKKQISLASFISKEEIIIKQKQTQIADRNIQIQLLKAQAEKINQSQKNLYEELRIVKERKECCITKIDQAHFSKHQLQSQNQKLTQSYEVQKTEVKRLRQILIKQVTHQVLITLPISNLYMLKKTTNNQLQQLRGNIRVYCRIRPLSQKQAPMNYQLKSHDILHIKKTTEQQKSENMKNDFQFVFDRIFDQKTTQEEVFSEISQLIQNAIDGANVCIFAYGQTGSGKTFTMQGKAGNKSTIGVIPRSTDLIFQEIEKYKENKWLAELDVSINEIYNDSVINLLTKSEMKMVKPLFTSVKSIKQVEDLFSKAISNRSTAFTLSNADSSRSHLIFIIRIRSRRSEMGKEKEKEKESNLVLVDLAGSQRVKQSGVSNQRLKEAQHINSSLSHLGQVIRSLKSNKGKTNFRNTKLTYFIEPYLQKGGKAIMFVNISPAGCDESQSINSLKFASTARQCRIHEKE